FDATSGRGLTNLVDRVPIGNAPLWGKNHGSALCCFCSTNLEYDPPQAYELWRLTNGALEQIWSSPGDAFVTETKQSDDRRAFYFNATKLEWPVAEDVDGDGRAEFFTRPKYSSSGIKAWGVNASGEIVQKNGQPAPKHSPPLPAGIPPLQGTTVPYL